MRNLEFQWLILKIDENAANKWSACLLCWFSTKGTSGIRITLQRSFCRSRYFTVLFYYAKTWRISSFSGLYWKLTKRRQKKRSACLICWFSTKGKTGWRITLQPSICRSRYFTDLLYYARTWRISLSFSGLYWKLTKRRQKNGRPAFCWFSTKGTTGRQITLQRSFCRSRYFTVLLYYAGT